MTEVGKTWYADEWLQSQRDGVSFNLTSSGYDYFIKNKIFDVKFLEGRVEAKIFDNFYNKDDYHNVSIEFNQFTKKEKERIINLIKDNSYYLALLSNNMLSEEFKKELDGVIFKKTFDICCDCFNFYGNACKHIMGLIFLLADEFDKDIFKFFKIHGLDLKKEFNLEKNKIASVDDFFKEDDFDYGFSEVKHLKYSLIPKLEDQTFCILEDNPLFFDKDFKELLRKFLRSFRRYKNQFFKIDDDEYENYIFVDRKYTYSDDFKENFNNKWKNPKNWNKFKIDIDNQFLINSIDVGEDLFSYDFEEYLLSFFAELHLYGDIDDYSDEIKFIYQVFLFSLELVGKIAIVPCLFEYDGSYIIRWLPASYNEYVDKFLEVLSKMNPGGILTYNGKEISKKQEVLALSSIFIFGLLYFYHDFGISKQLSRNYDKPAFDLFLGFTKEFKGPQKGNELLINNWIYPFNSFVKDYNIYFEFKDEGDIISFDLMVNDMRAYDIVKNKGKHYSEVLLDICFIEKFFPKIKDLIKTGRVLNFDLEGIVEFLESIMPIFEVMGISTVLPKSIQKYATPKLVLTPSREIRSKSYISKEDLKNFDWEVAVGENVISIKDFKKLVKGSENIVKIASDYVILDKKDTANFVKKLNKLNKLNDFEVMQTLLTGELEDIEVNVDNQLKNMFDDMIRFEEISIPENINAQLRDYQKIGFSWIVQNINNGFGSILADDMGLGKTIQTLAAIQFFKQRGDLEDKNVLIVMPNGLLLNWMREIEKFTPNLKAFIYHGNDRELPDEDFDILLTSYGVLRSDMDIIGDKEWFLMVIDEAQNIKNPGTKQSRAVKAINADNKLALSGTPIENRLSEYWSIFDFTNPHYLPSTRKFSKEYVKPIEKLKDETVLEKFKTITSPFILRRVKTDKNIIEDLPEKIVNDVYCNLTPKQAAIYQETLDSLLNDIYNQEGMDRKGIILKLITSLKQICNHPSQFSKSKVCKIADSGKMEVLIELLDNIITNGEKVIIFTQYVQMGDIIKKLVENKFETSVGFLHGSLNKEAKDKVIRDFQEGDNQILLASLKTGGTGLNLTAAQNVIHYDLWWNPAVENQATDRAYRIGQKENVMVYRLITSGTFEEEINEILKEKEELANLTVGSNQKFITEMDDQELANLLRLRK